MLHCSITAKHPEMALVAQLQTKSSVIFKMDSEGNRAVVAAMQAADEGSSGAADAGGSPGGPEVLGHPSVLEGQGVPASHCT